MTRTVRRPLAAALGLGLAGLATITTPAVAGQPGPDTGPSGAGAAVGVADPGPGMATDIDVADVVADLEQLQTIADQNGGNRATGQPGYRASLDWIRQRLDQAGFQTRVQSFETWSGTSYNLIADWPGGDAAHTVMFGSHLDSVGAGPGINDNGSGSAGNLEVALALAESGATPRNHIRFAWWGAEELGLLGSTHYVESLGAEQRDQLAAYFNFDMIASPNAGYFVYDDDPAGTAFRDSLTAWFEERGVPSEYVDVDGRSDHAAFMEAGVPTAGTFTGAEGVMTSEQAEKWGGQAGKAFDPCYHSACDTIDNVNRTALDVHVDAMAAMLDIWGEADFGSGLLATVA